jgi:predicted nucleic acid-binding protein
MSEFFLDTNICVYAFDNSEPNKREKAKSLLKKSACLSSQIIIETYLACSRKLKLPHTVCEENTRFLCDLCSLVQIDSAIFSLGLYIKSKYQFSFLDSVIVATALQADCAVLYSEDMQHNQVVEGKLKIINPFLQ